MPLSNTMKKSFRSIGHNLKPIITVAEKGLTDNVRAEFERALRDHELIKVKLVTANKEQKKLLCAEISQAFAAEPVQSIGHMFLLYRKAKKQDPRLSNVARHKAQM